MITSGHVTKRTVTPFDPPLSKNYATRKPDGSIFYRTGVWAIKVYIAGIDNLDIFSSCDLDLDPMTFIH